MASGNHFQLLDRQVMNDKAVFNAFHYLQTAGSGGAEECARAYVDYVLPDMIVVQSTALEHLDIEVINLDNFADYFTLGLTADNVGTASGDYLPPFVTWTFKMTRVERGHHNGRKAVSGVTEGQQENGQPNSGTAASINALAATLASPIFYGGNYFSPQIYRAPNSIKPGYDNDAAFYSIGGGFFVGISSQNSRKS
jgi:hypothetical protein